MTFSYFSGMILFMNTNNRKFLRFNVALQVEARGENKESALGIVRDFSRQGARVAFDRFEFEPQSSVELKIQRPEKDVFVPAIGKVMWKKFIAGRWEVGIKLVDFSPEVKIEILERAYDAWVKANTHYAGN